MTPTQHVRHVLVRLQIFMLFFVHAYSTRVWQRQEADNSKVSVSTVEHGFQSPDGHSKLIMDGPWSLLWPCVLLWPFLQAALSYGWIHNALSKALALCPMLLLLRSSGCLRGT